MDDAPRQQEQHEQRRQAVGVGGAADEIEVEAAEQRPDDHALQAVGAAGEPVELVGELVQHQRDAERHHQAREVACRAAPGSW